MSNNSNKLYDESVIFIGPSGAGKSTVAEVLSKRLNMPRLCLDRIANWARGNGIRQKFKSSDEFNSFMILEAIKRAKDQGVPGIVDFGAGHSIYEDDEIFEVVKMGMKPFKNVVLLLPCENEEEALRIMKERSTGDTNDNLMFLRSKCNKELATMTVYGNGRTPDEIADEILGKISERRVKDQKEDEVK